jgi:hypothetical protein
LSADGRRWTQMDADGKYREADAAVLVSMPLLTELGNAARGDAMSRARRCKRAGTRGRSCTLGRLLLCFLDS